jgi:hypothetical protein
MRTESIVILLLAVLTVHAAPVWLPDPENVQNTPISQTQGLGGGPLPNMDVSRIITRRPIPPRQGGIDRPGPSQPSRGSTGPLPKSHGNRGVVETPEADQSSRSDPKIPKSITF